MFHIKREIITYVQCSCRCDNCFRTTSWQMEIEDPHQGQGDLQDRLIVSGWSLRNDGRFFCPSCTVNGVQLPLLPPSNTGVNS